MYVLWDVHPNVLITSSVPMQAVFETTLTQKMDGVMIVQETTTDLADTLENASISAEKVSFLV